jgi:spore germination cell wall hydrolase CwlJ-like protein
MYFEARGDGAHGMHAVANVIMNRAKASGKSPYQVIVKPKQFSYLGRKNLVIKDVESHKIALRLAALAVIGKLPDITNGSTHYVAPKRLASIPKWTKEMERTVTVLDHQFFRG